MTDHSSNPPGARTKVLLFEDEKIVAEDLRDRLTSLGYSVPAVGSFGEDAVSLAEQFLPDVVLMDIRLKGAVDGIEAANQIRTRFNIPVVYLTAYADDQTFNRAMWTEPFGYILKPVENRELHTGIEMALYKHRLQLQLKQSEQWLSTTLRSIGDAVITADGQGRIKFMNAVAEQLTGWTQSEVLGQDLSVVFDSVRAKPATSGDDVFRSIIHGEALVDLPVQKLLVSKDGRVFPIDESLSPIRDEQGNVIGTVIVFKDASLRQRVEEALKNVSKNILDAQEAERRRVARELHDGVVQLLSTVRYRFNTVEEKLGLAQSDLHHDTNRIKELLERAIEEVRRISRNLRPSELDDLGLIPAIRIACEEFQERTRAKIEFKCSNLLQEVSPDTMLAVYRIVQEALSNIEKHANASEASILIGLTGTMMQVIIRDNGKGFNPQALKERRDAKSGYGIVNMMERAEFISAIFHLRSSPNQGTEIRLEIPISAHTRQENT